ncbi:MAG: hypothetical protein DI628_03405 [Blastochloris viridis]|uniref:Uncharacterized protein n=1 Tax=Blastochloris viridis TaxID=1079 RepID=A0A6N4RD87_BLAVI|nr:MAG: hypothetical protein DI628_03405 [Blastochloris viridis]
MNTANPIVSASAELTEADILAQLIQWAAGRPLWQQDALRRLCQIDALTEEDLNAVYGLCKDPTLPCLPVKAEHLSDPTASHKKVHLKKVCEVNNVNALAENQDLLFAPKGLTVIYGDNGSGKSGYTRILKQVCRARVRRNENVLGNIYKDGGIPSQAKIGFSVNDQNQEVTWLKDSAPPPALSAVSVFDSATASIHVDETNNVAYVPYPMELLRRLVQVTQDVKSKLQAEIDLLEKQTPAFLKNPPCSVDSPTGKLVRSLKGNIVDVAVESLATISEDEKKRLETLKVDLATDPAKLQAQLQAKKTKLEKIESRIAMMASAITDQQATEFNALQKTYADLHEAAKATAGNLFKDEPLPNVGGDVWKALWTAASRYSQTVYPGHPFPVTADGAHCPLCQQALDAAAADRLQRFQKFITNDVKQREQKAFSDYQARLAILKSAEGTIENLRALVTMITTEFDLPEAAQEVRCFILQAKWRLRAILRHQAALPPMPVWTSTLIQAEATALQKRIDDLTAKDAVEKRQKLVLEKNALDDRMWLAGVKADVLAEIARKKQIDALEGLKKQTDSAPITRKSTEMSEALVTNALKSRFAKEVNEMKLAGLAVELRQERSVGGAPQFKVALIQRPSQTVGSILSEGEFRCIALAAFMAEQATAHSQSGIVFDDPVSSLDHVHREAVALRLAKEAINRQVVVFTHDIAFLFYLNQAAKELGAEIIYRHITKRPDSSATGLCHNNAPPKAQPVDKRIESLQAALDGKKFHYDNGNTAEWERAVRELSDDLRFTWERAVEDVVGEVTSRFANKVKTPGLVRLTAVTMDDCKTMRESFARCSEWLHSPGASLNPTLPSAQDMQNEIDALRAWYTNLRERQGKIKITDIV